jgi:hypothetical protein
MRKWDANITNDHTNRVWNVGWILLARKMRKWWALMNTVMKRVSLPAEQLIAPWPSNIRYATECKNSLTCRNKQEKTSTLRRPVLRHQSRGCTSKWMQCYGTPYEV